MGHLKAAKVRKSEPRRLEGAAREMEGDPRDSEGGISGRKVVPNCVNVADVRICCWISNDLITGDSTI